MTETYVAHQMVKAQYEARWYGLAFPEGINPHIVSEMKEHCGYGTNVEEAKADLQQVIQGYCTRKICTPIGEPKIDLSAGTKVQNWLAEVWASIW